MGDPNRRLLITVLTGWAGFIALGFILRQGIGIPQVTIVIDRSYCEPQQWKTVADQYQVFYQQNQKRQIQIQSVILLSDLGEETLDTPLDPNAVQQLRTYGRKDPTKQQALQQRLQQELQEPLSKGAAQIEFLSCPVSPVP